MEITTLSNLVSLAIQVSGLGLDTNDAHISKTQFTEIVETIFDKISNLDKWNRHEDYDSENETEEEISDQEDDVGASEDTGESDNEDTNNDNDEDEVSNLYHG